MGERTWSAAEIVIRDLYAITSNYGVGFPAQLRKLLDLGRERLGLDMGIVARVEGTEYTVVQSAGPDAGPVPGDKFPLGDTFCEITLRAEGPVGFHNAGRDEYRLHPCYAKFGLEAYLGAPIRNRSGVFGTLNFSSVDARTEPFRDVDIDVIQLMATWIGGELERRNLEQNLETVHGMIPICASCKKIRSNLGDWQALEMYLQQHAQLKFTHGVCPTCVEQFDD